MLNDTHVREPVESVEQVVQAVPHEGYPRAFCDATDPSRIQTQCPVALTGGPQRQTSAFPAAEEEEAVPGGAIVRSRQALHGVVELRTEQPRPGLQRVTAVVENTSPWSGDDRDAALEGEFVSLMDPPSELKPFAALETA